MTTETVTLADLAGILDDQAEIMAVEHVRSRLILGMTHVLERIQQEAPRQTGAFVSSVWPYVGQPGATWSRQGGAMASASDVERVMAQWQPGQECGIATDAPYSRKIILQAGDHTGQKYKQGRRSRGVRKGSAIPTYTRHVSPGWVDVIIAEANQLMEAHP